MDSTVLRRPSSWAVWLMAARPATLAAAVAPVLVGSGAAAREEFRPHVMAAALVAALLIQVGTNLANDLADYQRGADTSDRLGPPRVTAQGLLSPGQVRAATYIVFGLAAAVGLYLVALGGWPALVIGAGAILAGLTYTGGPWPYGYHALGDLVCFLFFGVAAVTGTYYLYTDEFAPIAFLASLPVGLLVTAILVVNNLRDIETDRRAHKVTLAVLLGPQRTRLQYAAFLALAYLLLPLLLPAGASPWAFLPVLTLPLALRPLRSVLGGTSGRALNPVLKQTARLHLLFGALLGVGLAL